MEMTTSEEAKADAFFQPEVQEIAGIKVRPMTGETLAILQRIKSPFLTPANLTQDDPEFFYHFDAFLFIHSEDPKRVRTLSRTPEDFFQAVSEFSGQFKASDIQAKINFVVTAIKEAFAGRDYEVEGTGDISPN